jgi:hypothetical protein
MNMAHLYKLMKEALDTMGLSFGQMDQVSVELSPTDNTIVFTRVGPSFTVTLRVKLEQP